VRNAFSVM